MYFCSPFHLCTVMLVFGIGVGIWRLLKNQKKNIQKIVLLLLMLTNALQHILKFRIYPQYSDTGFTILSTSYNVCATLILSAPLIFLWGNRFLKNSLYFIGMAAGIGTIIFPFWFFGTPVEELGWNYYRFYICHALLFFSCSIPLFLGIHKPYYREFWQVGLGFLLVLCVILVNNVVFICIGLYPDGMGNSLYEQLLQINPCMMMAPKIEFSWLNNILCVFSSPVFLGDNTTGYYAPILWYALPVYIGICIAVLPLFSMLDRKNLGADFIKLKKKCRNSRKND